MERITTHSAKGLKLKKGKKFVELLSDKQLTLKALNQLAELEDQIESGQLSYLPEAITAFFDFLACRVGDWEMPDGKFFWDLLYEARNEFADAWGKAKGNIDKLREELKRKS